MMEMPASQPAPQKSSSCLPLFAALVTIALCFVCMILFFIGAYYSTDIARQIGQYLNFKPQAPYEIEPEGFIPADETDTSPLPHVEDFDPTFHAFAYLPEGGCVFTGGVTKPWTNGPKNLNYVGIINQTTQESGFSQQAYMEHWTEQRTVLGYEYPLNKVEIGNDGGIQLEVCNIEGQLYVFMPDRTGDSDVPFHQGSFTQLVGTSLLVCSDDDGRPGDWNGRCDGETDYVVGIPIEDFIVPGDLAYAWSMMEDVLYDLPGGKYRLPAYGEMLDFWINQQ